MIQKTPNPLTTEQYSKKTLWIVLFSLLLYTFCLFFFVSRYYQPKPVDYQLHIEKQKIPFLVKEVDLLQETKTSYYLGMWNLRSNEVSQDDMPLFTVEGDCRIFWNGNTRLFVSSLNARGSVLTAIESPFFSLHEIHLQSPNDAFVLDAADSDLFYVIDHPELSNEYFLETWSRGEKKNTSLCKFDTSEKVSNFLPLCFTWKNNQPFLIGEGEMDSIPVMFTGTIQNKEMVLHPVGNSILNWNTSDRDPNRVAYYGESVLLSQINPMSVQSYHLEEEKLNNFETVNNYIDMFYNYLFGTTERESSLIRRGIYLEKPEPVHVQLGVYEDYLLTKWNPSVNQLSAGETIEFPVVQLQSIQNDRLVSRIDQVNTSINVYSAFSSNEIDAIENKIQLHTWILPGT